MELEEKVFINIMDTKIGNIIKIDFCTTIKFIGITMKKNGDIFVQTITVELEEKL